MITIILLSLSVVCNVVLTYVFVRAVKKLFQFDELFDLLQDDLETNVKHLTKMMEQPLLMNTPEVVDAHRNMATMRLRLIEYGMRVRETKGTAAEEKKKQLPRPVVA